MSIGYDDDTCLALDILLLEVFITISKLQTIYIYASVSNEVIKPKFAQLS